MGRAAVDGFERLYETARALGEETRFRIYRRIWLASAPVGVSELAEAFSLHPNAVRQHLARLEQAGLIVSRADRLGAAGRPRRMYEPSPEPVELGHPPGSARSLVTMLAEAMETLPTDRRRLVEFARLWGRAWSSRRRRRDGAPRSRRGRAELLARQLTEWGWRPTISLVNGRLRVATERCLFHEEKPGNNGRCCALEEGLLTGFAESVMNGQPGGVSVEGCRLELML